MTLKTVPGDFEDLVKFGEKRIKTVEGPAGCARRYGGLDERKEGGERKIPAARRHEISRDDAGNMIMQARVIAGWITEDDLVRRPTGRAPGTG